MHSSFDQYYFTYLYTAIFIMGLNDGDSKWQATQVDEWCRKMQNKRSI